MDRLHFSARPSTKSPLPMDEKRFSSTGRIRLEETYPGKVRLILLEYLRQPCFQGVAAEAAGYDCALRVDEQVVGDSID